MGQLINETSQIIIVNVIHHEFITDPDNFIQFMNKLNYFKGIYISYTNNFEFEELKNQSIPIS